MSPGPSIFSMESKKALLFRGKNCQKVSKNAKNGKKKRVASKK